MKAVVTDPTAFLTLDLYTVKPEDLTFNAPFSLKVRRSDFIHALIAWFDIDFTACHRPIRFSTGPHTKYTHWKQTVFYINDALTVEEGEVVSGMLRNKPNEQNKRDLDIRIEYRLETEDPTRAGEGVCDYKMYVSPDDDWGMFCILTLPLQVLSSSISRFLCSKMRATDQMPRGIDGIVFATQKCKALSCSRYPLHSETVKCSYCRRHSFISRL